MHKQQHEKPQTSKGKSTNRYERKIHGKDNLRCVSVMYMQNNDRVYARRITNKHMKNDKQTHEESQIKT